MANDLIVVIQWWGTLFLVGAAAYPLTKTLFKDWWDRGYLFAKAVGMASVTYLVYLLGTLHIVPFSQISIGVAMGIVFVLGVLLSVTNARDWGKKGNKGKDIKIIITFFLEEAFFFAALLFWSWIKAHEPSIHGLEKFMDFGFTRSVLDSRFFPAPDMWYSGGTINYYYFGHIVMAMLTKFSGLDLRYTFNLMLASLFAFTLTMSFSIGKQLWGNQGKRGERGMLAGALTAFLVTLGGNLQTIYAFTRGYSGDKVKPFWQLLWPIWEMKGIGEIWGKIGEGFNRYWYANATRFIPYTIHEFPSYSFVVSDVHGHVLSLPFVLLAVALLISIFFRFDKAVTSDMRYVTGKTRKIFINFGMSRLTYHMLLIFYGFLVAVLLMTNALDGPIYLGLFLLIITFFHKGTWGNKGIIFAIIAAVSGIFSLPFLFHFQSFVHGLAIDCPPAFLADTKIGPFLFEGVEKCQHSPLWMMLILWGFFLYCGFWLIIKNVKCLHPRRISLWLEISNVKTKFKIQINQLTPVDKLLIVFFLFSIALIIFPEFFYFKDIYPMHFRSNTMFKLGYQAFILFSIVAAYTVVKFIFERFHDDSEVKIQNSKV